MKAGSVWIGTDYAWISYPKRGGPLPMHAKRVKVLKKYEKQKYGRDRNSTFVLVLPLEEDGQVRNPDTAVEDRFETEARNLVMLWENYEEERNGLNAQREKEEREWQEAYDRRQREREEKEAITAVALFFRGIQQRGERLERQRLAEQKQQALEAHLNRIRNVLITRGFKPHTLTVTEYSITIPTEEVERWLGIDNENNKHGVNQGTPSEREKQVFHG